MLTVMVTCQWHQSSCHRLLLKLIPAPVAMCVRQNVSKDLT